MKRQVLWRLSLFGAGLLTGILALQACGDDDSADGDAAEVEAAVSSAFEAWTAQDADAFLAAFTDNGLQVMFESTREELAAEYAAEGMDDTPMTVGEFSDTEVDGEEATTTAPLFYGGMGSPQIFSLVKESDVWLIDNREATTGDAGDATVVDLSLTEYAFDFDPSAITSGDIAFDVTGDGAEEHEVFIARVPEDLDIEAALQSEEEPEGVEDIGAVFGITSGARTTAVFQEPLEPGRYVMLCFVSAADGEPHAFKGMINEFTIGNGAPDTTPADGGGTPEAEETAQ